MTPLHLAVDSGDVELVIAMLMHGAVAMTKNAYLNVSLLQQPRRTRRPRSRVRTAQRAGHASRHTACEHLAGYCRAAPV